MIKKQMQGDDPTYRTTSKQHLLAAAEASKLPLVPLLLRAKGLGAVTAMLTNPIWVVKVRVFATGRTDPAYRGLVSEYYALVPPSSQSLLSGPRSPLHHRWV